MLIQRIHIKPTSDAAEDWPYNAPVIEQITAEGLRLTNPLTFLVAENGSGKSTLMEAIAEAWGIDPRGGRGKKRPRPEPGSLAAAIYLGYTPEGARMHAGKGRSNSYFLRAESPLGLLEYVSAFRTIVPGYL